MKTKTRSVPTTTKLLTLVFLAAGCSPAGLSIQDQYSAAQSKKSVQIEVSDDSETAISAEISAAVEAPDRTPPANHSMIEKLTCHSHYVGINQTPDQAPILDTETKYKLTLERVGKNVLAADLAIINEKTGQMRSINLMTTEIILESPFYAVSPSLSVYVHFGLSLGEIHVSQDALRHVVLLKCTSEIVEITQ